MQLSLRNKVLVVLMSVALLPLVLLSSLGIYFINLAQQWSVVQLQTQLLSQKEKEIEKFITETQTLFHVQVAAQVAALSGIPFDQREFLLQEIVKANRAISEISFLEYDPSYPDKPEIGLELNKMVGGELEYSFQNRRETAEFQRVMSGNDYFGPIYEKNGTLYMTVSSPVRNKDGAIIGVVAGELSLQVVDRMIADARLGSSGYLVLADHRGVIWSKPPHLSFDGFGTNVYLQSVVGGEINLLGKTEEYISSFGDFVVASSRKIQGLGWVLVAEWPRSDAYAVVSTIMKQAAIFVGLVVGIIIIASFLLAYRIIRPVRVLEQGAHIIGGGNLKHRIDIHTGDELEALAARFNAMAKNLGDIQELREVKAHAQGLVASLKKEKELSKIKDQFIATASHQLRTPVSVLRWMTESLRSSIAEGKKEEIAEQLKALSENISSLSLVIGDILIVAELGIGYTPSSISEFSLLDKTRDAVGKFSSDAAEKHITITLLADEQKKWSFKGSSLNISRALEHLIANAIVYTKEKGTIHIALDQNDKSIVFSVKDDGIGVPEDDQKLLFGEFFRARNSVEMKNVGTGLGLFIVKTIIEGHGGTVGVESPADWEGRKLGSKFYFTIPMNCDIV